jgi:homocitrate synthase NifV
VKEVNDIRSICNMGFNFKTLAWCRADKSDILFASQAGTNGVHISFPVSPILMEVMDKTPKWIMQQLNELIDVSLDYFQYVSVGAQDASRADFSFLKQFVGAASSYGAARVRLADTVGVLNPISTQKLISKIKSIDPKLSLEIHAHNDLGMATANTLAAYMAGATCLSTTVNGLGERAGNAPMEEVAMALKLSAKVDTGLNSQLFQALCSCVSSISKRMDSYSKPITGKMALSHESGIHTNCLLKNRNSYQLISASSVGRCEDEFIIGKHSGKATVEFFLKKAQLKCDEQICIQLLNKVKERSEKLQRSLTKNEFYNLYSIVSSPSAQFVFWE